MFPKKQRLCKKKEIQNVFDGNISAYNQLFGLKAKKSDLKYNRYTIIISTKVSKIAVERNRIKRIVKRVLRENDAKVKGFVDCIIITLKPANKQSKEDIERAIKNLLQRTRLI